MESTLCRRYNINRQNKRRTCHYSLTIIHPEATELENISLTFGLKISAAESHVMTLCDDLFPIYWLTSNH